METNEENTNKNQQDLFLKYFIESIQKQQEQSEPFDFSTKFSQQSPALVQNKHQPFGSYSSLDNQLNSKEDRLKQFYKHLLNLSQQNEIKNSVSNNSTPEKKHLSPTSSKNQDDLYWERRKKNNEAAKRSRDARRVKEDRMAFKAAWLEQENVKLRLENAHLKQENIHLRCKIYSSIES
ncbi:unnamed protein product [Rotaria socialis]|uniref:BZIP domain-containing protein n=1 Tax=Rotaria socialis TaxID=392032 RepID=A0A821I089_9BILA|nr:unnamed protein product [Rotaria socialis]CAF4693856.1 unnamed protein product [Rotaria socialis]